MRVISSSQPARENIDFSYYTFSYFHLGSRFNVLLKNRKSWRCCWQNYKEFIGGHANFCKLARAYIRDPRPPPPVSMSARRARNAQRESQFPWPSRQLQWEFMRLRCLRRYIPGFCALLSRPSSSFWRYTRRTYSSSYLYTGHHRRVS